MITEFGMEITVELYIMRRNIYQIVLKQLIEIVMSIMCIQLYDFICLQLYYVPRKQYVGLSQHMYDYILMGL